MLPEVAISHGIANLIYAAQNKKSNISSNALSILKKHNTEYQIINNFIDSEAKKLLTQMNKSKLNVVVLKGFSLSHQIYLQPHLRPKTDIDIIIHPEDEASITHFFQQNDYSNPRGWKASAISNEFSMVKSISKGVRVNFDVHVKISNSKPVEHVINFNELLQSADKTTLTHINLVSKPYALIHAVIHLMHHKASGDLIKIIWYYDIYLLIEQLSEHEKQSLKNLIIQKELVTVITKCLTLTAIYFNSTKIESLIVWGNQPEITKNSNNSYKYLLGNTYGIKGLWLTLKTTEGIKNKWLVIQETAFPPKEEIYKKYGETSRWLLPLLYIKRILTGSIKYIFKQKK